MLVTATHTMRSRLLDTAMDMGTVESRLPGMGMGLLGLGLRFGG
jgi:hypothetical protein